MSSTLTVDLGDRSYPIVIGRGLLDGGFDLSRFVRGTDCLVVSNETVAPLYYRKLLPNLASCEVAHVNLPDGEVYKTVATMQTVLDALAESRANRDVCLIALGGGVVGDIAGFAAACYMRGIDFIQVPTTLLAQVDSSVGGKTGVNHEHGKNLIGAFHQPQVVLIDTDTLGTLPDRELSAGLAEVIKHGAICDAQFFAWLESNIAALRQRDPAALEHAIRRCCEIKAEVVAEDEREAGRRAILNFGHTFGHALESVSGFAVLHGEAVAAGMLAEAYFGEEIGITESGTGDRLGRALFACGLPQILDDEIDLEALLKAAQSDKKVREGTLRWVLLHGIGRVAEAESGVSHEVPLHDCRGPLAAALLAATAAG